MTAPRGALALVLGLPALVVCGCGAAIRSRPRQDEHPDRDGDRHLQERAGRRSEAAVRRVNRARTRLAAACKKLEAAPDDAAALRTLRGAARTYLAVFETSPDGEFRVAPTHPRSPCAGCWAP